MESTFIVLLVALSVTLMYFLYYQSALAEELKILESKLNKNSITGVIQNQHDYPVHVTDLRAEFYDKDGGLVGIRDFFKLQKYDLEPNEKTTFKLFEKVDYMREFPKTDYIIKAEGLDGSKYHETTVDKIISDLNRIPREITTTVTIAEKNTTGTNATGTNATQMNVGQMNVTQMNVGQMNGNISK